jgi:hypothetical protein
MERLSSIIMDEIFDDDVDTDNLYSYVAGNPNEHRYHANIYRAQQLVDAKIAPNLEEALIMVKDDRKHRPPLDYCRDTAEKYIKQLTPEEYRGLFRMSEQLFEGILSKVSAHFAANGQARKGGKKSTPIKFLLLATLRWLAGGSPHDIMFVCGMRYRTFRKIRWDMVDALIDIYYLDTIKLPTTEAEREELSKGFQEKTNMEGILGAIDGLLIRMKLPPGVKNARPYLCYKSFYALNMQGIAGPNGELLYINIGHKGATGDGCASRDSLFWKRCADNEFKYTDGFYFLGDAAYSLMPWLMCPIPGSHLPDTRGDVYNNYLSKGRQVIERAFGMLVNRWRIMVAGLESMSIRSMVKIVKVCCLLHNLCLRDNMSRKIIVSRDDAHRHPFDPAEVTDAHTNAVLLAHGNKKGKIVGRIRTHVPTYTTPGAISAADMAAAREKLLRSMASGLRDRIATELPAKGSRRLKPRGHKRSAAYQMK